MYWICPRCLQVNPKESRNCTKCYGYRVELWSQFREEVKESILEDVSKTLRVHLDERNIPYDARVILNNLANIRVNRLSLILERASINLLKYIPFPILFITVSCIGILASLVTLLFSYLIYPIPSISGPKYYIYVFLLALTYTLLSETLTRIFLGGLLKDYITTMLPKDHKFFLSASNLISISDRAAIYLSSYWSILALYLLSLFTPTYASILTSLAMRGLLMLFLSIPIFALIAVLEARARSRKLMLLMREIRRLKVEEDSLYSQFLAVIHETFKPGIIVELPYMKVREGIIGKPIPLPFKKITLRPLSRPLNIGGYYCRHIIAIGGLSIVLHGVKDGIEAAIKIPAEVGLALVLGRGGIGKVEDSKLKVFIRELRLLNVLNKLNHPHIVRCYDFGYTPLPFIALEYCENGSLKGVLEVNPILPSNIVVLMALQICDALQAAYNIGLEYHGDLKPENILFTSNGILKVTDFNIARIMGTLSERLSEGTIGYSAPEQFILDLVGEGEKRDVFSLGVIMYECLTGRLPFPLTSDSIKYVTAIKESKPETPDKINPTVPKELSNLILKMLNYYPDERPSMKEVYLTLQAILENI